MKTKHVPNNKLKMYLTAPFILIIILSAGCMRYAEYSNVYGTPYGEGGLGVLEQIETPEYFKSNSIIWKSDSGSTYRAEKLADKIKLCLVEIDDEYISSYDLECDGPFYTWRDEVDKSVRHVNSTYTIVCVEPLVVVKSAGCTEYSVGHHVKYIRDKNTVRTQILLPYGIRSGTVLPYDNHVSWCIPGLDFEFNDLAIDSSGKHYIPVPWGELRFIRSGDTYTVESRVIESGGLSLRTADPILANN